MFNSTLLKVFIILLKLILNLSNVFLSDFKMTKLIFNYFRITETCQISGTESLSPLIIVWVIVLKLKTVQSRWTVPSLFACIRHQSSSYSHPSVSAQRNHLNLGCSQ